MAKLTDQDLSAIRDLMRETLKDGIEEFGLITQEDIHHLPTKEDFYKSQDELMGELKAMREEHQLLSGRVYRDHEPRISSLEKKLES